MSNRDQSDGPDDAQVNVPNETQVEAAVNTPYSLTLYSEDGAHAVQISSEDIDYWIRRGFRRNRLDLKGNISEIIALMDAAKVAIGEFVDGIVADGFIDPSDESAGIVANRAMSLIGDKYTQLITDIHALYPVRATGVTVELVKDGEVITVDASQEELYTTVHGYTKVGG